MGYYRCGDFKAESGYIGGRIGAKDGAVIRFKAAKSGYFGIGNDSGNITEGIYLKAGEEGDFSPTFNTGRTSCYTSIRQTA